MLQKDKVAASTAAIEKIFANPDAETAELIKQAQEEYDSKLFSVLELCSRVRLLLVRTNARTRVCFLDYVLFFLQISRLGISYTISLHS